MNDNKDQVQGTKNQESGSIFIVIQKGRQCGYQDVLDSLIQAMKDAEEGINEPYFKGKQEESVPTPAWNEITSFDQVLKAKPGLTDEELALINYSGKSQRMLGARGFLKTSLITEVINDGWVADFDNPNQKKWEIIWKKTPSGFGLSLTAASADCVNAYATVGVRLCFETEEKARHVAKHFAAEWNEFLIINK